MYSQNWTGQTLLYGFKNWSSKQIPQLLSTVYYDLINEEIWEILKEFKFPTINFQILRHFVIAKIKKTLPEVF
jgi:hypothetical protein